MRRYFILILALIALSGCVTRSARIIRPTREYSRPPKITSEQRERLVGLARQALGKARVLERPNLRADCSGTIRALFAQAKIPLGGIIKTSGDNDVKAIY